MGADGWFQRAGGAAGDGLQQQEAAGFAHSLSEFLDTMGSAMAALGLFSQVRNAQQGRPSTACVLGAWQQAA